MVLLPPQQQQRRTQQQKIQCPDKLGSKPSSHCSKNHHLQDDRNRRRTPTAVAHYCNAMTQTAPETPKQVTKTPIVSNVVHSPSSNNALHWSLATSSGLAKHKLPDNNTCLNASEKVLAACQAVEVSAASLHSLVECLRMLPQSTDNTLVPEKDNSKPRLVAGAVRSGGVRPLRTSSPVEPRRYSPNVASELALLLEKVRELRVAAADADRELISLRAENAYLKRLQLSRRSMEATPFSVKQPIAEPVAPKVVQQQPTSSISSSPFVRYPNLRTLLMPETSSLLSEVASQQQEDWPPVTSSLKVTPSVDCFCNPNIGSLSAVSSPMVVPTIATSSPFYAALQSADDGLTRLRRHLATVQPTSSFQQ